MSIYSSIHISKSHVAFRIMNLGGDEMKQAKAKLEVRSLKTSEVTEILLRIAYSVAFFMWKCSLESSGVHQEVRGAAEAV